MKVKRVGPLLIPPFSELLLVARLLLRKMRRVGLLAAALFSLLLLGYVVLKWAPDRFAETKGLDAKARADARQGVRTASLALLAGTLGVVGAVYTARTYALARAGQLTDRFSKAIEQLGQQGMEVRLGAIYALERIARDSSYDHPQIFEVLTAYVRERVTLKPETSRPRDLVAITLPRPAPDIQAVLTVIGRRNLGLVEK